MRSSRFLISSAAAALLILGTLPAQAAGEAVHPPEEHWSFTGLFGTFDRSALQRGFEVYNGVCAACHSMRLLAYRNLEHIGYSEAQAKAIAASKEVTDGPNDQGEMYQRAGRLMSYRYTSWNVPGTR